MISFIKRKKNFCYIIGILFILIATSAILFSLINYEKALKVGFIGFIIIILVHYICEND